MRVNLITKSSMQLRSGTVPLSLTIRPACGLPGDYEFSTNSAELMRMLYRQTDLPHAVLKRFEESLFASPGAKLLGVELSENVLTEIGYFVD